MVQLTKEATKHLAQVRGERGHTRDEGARFHSRGKGLGLTFLKQPEPGDRVIEADGIHVYLAPDVAERLDRGVIDVGEKDGKEALFFKRRPASGQPA